MSWSPDGRVVAVHQDRKGMGRTSGAASYVIGERDVYGTTMWLQESMLPTLHHAEERTLIL